MRDRLIVWAALGFGIGRLPKAPGTYGAVLGLLWFWGLSYLPNLWLWCFVSVIASGAGVWLCSEAEQILKAHDPGCIVIDEIVAVPVAGLGWIAWRVVAEDPNGALSWAWDVSTAAWVVIVFLLFRLFDILKPWPVGGVQKLPRGWGVMADDILAAGYVALITFGVRWGYSLID